VSASSGPASLLLDAETTELPRLRAWLEQLGHEHQLGTELLYRLTFCAEELVTNIIMHGYGPEAHGSIRVRLDTAGSGAELTIEDDGRPFDPTAIPPPKKARSLEEAPIGGLGLHMVRQSSSRMEYRRLGGMNHVMILFCSSPAQAGPTG